jgi:hypothetical protein
MNLGFQISLLRLQRHTETRYGTELSSILYRAELQKNML